jgi:hypothetical protein
MSGIHIIPPARLLSRRAHLLPGMKREPFPFRYTRTLPAMSVLTRGQASFM